MREDLKGTRFLGLRLVRNEDLQLDGGYQNPHSQYARQSLDANKTLNFDKKIFNIL